MKFPRASGILLHPTSLPGERGIGELGPQAYRFLDYLREAGMKIWQVLPLNPTGYGDSPYQSFSAFAGNPILISLDLLAEQGLLGKQDLANAPDFPDDRVEFAQVIAYKHAVLRVAAKNFHTQAKSELRAEYAEFVTRHASWLDDFALFMAAKDAHQGVVWTEWASGLAKREPDALKEWGARLADEIAAHKFWQFEFYRQWHAIRHYANEHGIRIMGDLPIYVAHDSADVWAHPGLFFLDERGTPTKVAGVPPDYFSATGQLWGNPIYRWEAIRQHGYRWWIERFRAVLEMFDMVRVDHFRGFEAHWEIPAGEPTAMNGKWVKGPGADLFEAVTRALGELPIVAENLGVITPAVEAIRHQFGYPGMAILQFAFSTDPQAPSFRPHNYVRALVAYTGGHDNDTMFGWWRGGTGESTRSPEDVRKEHHDAQMYFDVFEADFDREVNWIFIREVMRSVADTVLFPMQDVLGLGSEARMNIPGTLGRNWKWRMKPDDLRHQDAERLKEWTEIYER